MRSRGAHLLPVAARLSSAPASGGGRAPSSFADSRPNRVASAFQRFETDANLVSQAAGGSSSPDALAERRRAMLLLDAAKRAESYLSTLHPHRRAAFLSAAMRDPKIRSELDGLMSAQSPLVQDQAAALQDAFGSVLREAEAELPAAVAADRPARSPEEALRRAAAMATRLVDGEQKELGQHFRDVARVAASNTGSVRGGGLRADTRAIQGRDVSSPAGRVALKRASDAVAAAGFPTTVPKSGPTNLRFDRVHEAEADEQNSQHALGGRRYSWRPNFDLHQERYNWLPLEDRVYRELPAAPRVAPSYIPPVDGDEVMESTEEAMQSLEVHEPYVDLLKSTSESGKGAAPFPVVMPKVRVAALDAQGRAVGRGGRKTAQATAWLRFRGTGAAAMGAMYADDRGSHGRAHFVVNGRPLAEYFPQWLCRDACLQPLSVVERHGFADVEVSVHGGGSVAQSEAVRMAVAQALCAVDPAFRPALKAAEMLRRDPRMVLPKLSGRKKARKMKQWRKR